MHVCFMALMSSVLQTSGSSLYRTAAFVYKLLILKRFLPCDASGVVLSWNLPVSWHFSKIFMQMIVGDGLLIILSSLDAM